MNAAPHRRSPPRRPEQTREALLAAGTEVFAQQGFDGATVEAISQRAGVNKALISYHFQGKAKLYQAILLDHFETTSRQVLALAASPESAAVRLRQIIELMREKVRRRPALPAMLLREAVAGGERIETSVLRFMGAMATAVQGVIADGVAAGEFRRVDPHPTYLSLIGGLLFYYATVPFRTRLHRRGRLNVALPTPEEYTHHMTEFMLRALAPEPVRRRKTKR